MQEIDPHYLLIDGRRWRRSDPAIPEDLRQQLVNELMSARRAVGAALRDNDAIAERRARTRVQDAKLALGERGRAWWLPRQKADMSRRLNAAIRSLLRAREYPKTICPSEAARICGGEQWQDWLPTTRDVAAELVRSGWLDIVQRGQTVSLEASGPIRLRRHMREGDLSINS